MSIVCCQNFYVLLLLAVAPNGPDKLRIGADGCTSASQGLSGGCTRVLMACGKANLCARSQVAAVCCNLRPTELPGHDPCRVRNLVYTSPYAIINLPVAFSTLPH